jgi:hypothetical protein
MAMAMAKELGRGNLRRDNAARLVEGKQMMRFETENVRFKYM